VSSVCEGNRFKGLEDGHGFIEKLQFFISLREFIKTFFHYVRKTLPRFLQKLSFDKNLAEKPKSSVFENFFDFCSFILVDLL
jgi:hypothetical protein